MKCTPQAILERRFTNEKSKRILTIIMCIAFIAAIGCVFSANAGETNNTPGHIHNGECYTVDTENGVTREYCNACGGWSTISVCRGVEAFGHQDTHTVNGKECTRIYTRGYLDHRCAWCNNIVSSVFGHYCATYHTVCDDEPCVWPIIIFHPICKERREPG